MTRCKRFKAVLVGCGTCFLVFSGCRESSKELEDMKLSQEADSPESESSISVLHFACPQPEGGSKQSTMSLKIRANQNEKVFFRIQEGGDRTKVIPNSGIIVMKNGEGTLTSKAGTEGEEGYRITLTDSLNRSLTTDCTTDKGSG